MRLNLTSDLFEIDALIYFSNVGLLVLSPGGAQTDQPGVEQRSCAALGCSRTGGARCSGGKESTIRCASNKSESRLNVLLDSVLVCLYWEMRLMLKGKGSYARIYSIPCKTIH